MAFSSHTVGGRRVVVTGAGLLSPAGNDLDAFWQGITCGRSAVRTIRNFNTEGMPINSGGEVDNAALQAAVSDTAFRKTDRAVLLGTIAAERALDDAGIKDAARDGLRVGCIIGSGFGPIPSLEECYGTYYTKGWQSVRPTTIPRCMFNVLPSAISVQFHLTGQHQAVAAACSSGSMAMTNAVDAIRSGHEDVVLTGGVDAPLIHSIYSAWLNMRILAKNPIPEKACRPFDKGRDGIVLAEGAGLLVFEELEHARARGAKIYGEILGYGVSSDARHMTNPGVEGQTAALRQALSLCGVAPEEVDYINAHGTSTVLNDLTETQAIKAALGEAAARKALVSSTKSVTGHAMGASSALGLIASLLAMRRKTAPPTVNLEEPDPECDLDYVPNTPRPAAIRTVLCNTFAFGGANAVIVVRAFLEN